jgi:hypothetical protein
VSSRRTFLAIATALASVGVEPTAFAQPPSFLAEVDRNQVAAGEVFIYQVTLNVADQSVEEFQPPEWKGLRVVHAPQGPNRSTQMQIGGGGTFIQNSFSWQFQLSPLPGQKGSLTIGPARIEVDGRVLRSNVVSLRVTAGGAGSAPSAAAAPPPPQAAPSGDAPPPLASAAQGSFLRVVPDKQRAYVGEQITVGWYLYITQRQDKYDTVTEPRTDAFWTEDLTSPTARNRLTLTQEMVGGQAYQVALLFKKALFPLRAGRLTISPLESEVSQVDFFGSVARNQRLKSDATVIEAMPLPRAGQPANFDPAAVGRFSISAALDRTEVGVGEAVTLTVELEGEGNIRQLRPPKVPKLEGWKSYEPKVAVNVVPGDTISGRKTVEYLLLPERSGTTVFPSFEIAYFDPAAKVYRVEKSEPLRVVVAGGAAAAAPTGTAGSAPSVSPPAGVENVLSAEIRPIHARPTLRRDLGASFYRSRLFGAIVIVPPLGLVLAALAGRVRGRLTEDNQRSRRRRVRQMVRKRLGAAERHRQTGNTAACFIEVERVLREVLTARLGTPVSGLRMDELRALLRERGLPAAETDRLIAELEQCDAARFAPGAVSPEATAAALERAGDLMLAIEKAPLRDGASPT